MHEASKLAQTSQYTIKLIYGYVLCVIDIKKKDIKGLFVFFCFFLAM